MTSPESPIVPDVVADSSDAIARLITYGEADIRNWPNYVEELGLNDTHIGDLIAIATDSQLHRSADNVAVWAPLHAWRALGQLKATAAIDPLIGLLSRLDDDWSFSELPIVLGKIGPAALPSLTQYLADPKHSVQNRIQISQAIQRVGNNYPDVRDECVAILSQQLSHYARQNLELNSFIVGDLLDLKAVEAAPLIEQAFEADRVLDFIGGNWGDVQVDLGLKTREEIPETRYSVEEMNLYFKSQRGFGGVAAAKKTQTSEKKKKKKK